MRFFEKSKLVTAAILCAIAMTGHASIYKSVDNNGVTSYSDKKTDGAEEIDLPGVNSIPARSSRTATGTSEEGGSAQPAVDYQNVTITSPVHEETIDNGEGNFDINTLVTPGLANEHVLAFILDGREISRGPMSSIRLTNVSRGEHVLAVEVRDGDDQPLKRSADVTVFVKRPIARANNANVAPKAPQAPRAP